MRFLFLLLTVLLIGCAAPVDPGKGYLKLVQKPTVANALVCVASYDEFCTAYGYPKGQRNRQWIQRLRLLTAKKLLTAFTDAQLNAPMLRKLWMYPTRKCRIKKNRVDMEFRGNKKHLHVHLDSCRLTPSGKVLPSVFRFYTAIPHPNRVK